MQKTSPYAGSTAVLELAKLIDGLTTIQIDEFVWEARVTLYPQERAKLEEIFDEEIKKLKDSGCSEELISSYLKERTEVIKSMLAQCIYWEQKIPEKSFIFKDNGKVDYFRWRKHWLTY